MYQFFTSFFSLGPDMLPFEGKSEEEPEAEDSLEPVKKKQRRDPEVCYC